MPETRARFLANTIGATSASNDFTLPDGVGTDKQVLQTDGAGGTTWATTLSAPTISSVTGSLNVYEDGVSEDGGVLTINGTDFGNDASTLSVQISGTTGFAVIAETTTISITSSGTQFTATFTGAETNYNHSSFAAGSTIYVKVTKSGLQTSAYATLGTAMTGDPSFQTTSTTASTHTGTLAATSLGSYGGQVAGGGDDSNTKLLLNFDRTGGTDIEDSSNTGGDGHKITATNALIKSSPFGDGKSAMFFDGVDGTNLTVNSWVGFGAGDFTFEFWMNCTDHDPDTYSSEVVYGGDAGNNGGFQISIEKTSGNLQVYDNQADAFIITNSTATHLPENTWMHVALVRDTGTVKLYMDGNQVGSNSNSSDFNSDLITLGRYRGGNGYNYKGYLDEVRAVVGTAVYTGDFDVPTSRLSAIQSNQGTNIADIASGATKLLIHSNLEPQNPKDRTSEITVSNAGVNAGSLQNVVNGKSTNDTNGGVQLSGSNSLNFDLGSAKKISSYRFIQSTTNAHGTVSLKASNNSDFSSEVTVSGPGGSFGDDGTTDYFRAVTHTTAYRYYRLVTSGSWHSTPWITDISFHELPVDSSDSGHAITVGGSASHSTAHGGIAPALAFPASLKKTGSAGLFFNGTNSYAEVSNSGLTLGTTFTIEMWVYFLTKQDSAFYHHRYDASNDNLIWYDESASSLKIDTDETPRVAFTFNPSTHRWYHLALSVNNSTATLYVDGSSVGSGTLTGGFPAINATIRIGNRHNADRYFHGYLDGYRIQQGVAQTFTAPPTKIYGAYRSQDVGTIQLNATAGTGGGALDYAELDNGSGGLQSGQTALSTYGLSLNQSTGAITGTLTGLDDNSNSGNVIRIRARANADDNRVTTLGGSSFTGITQNDNTAPVLFNARRYHGSGVTGKDLKNYGFDPDFAWIKRRNGSAHGVLVDSVRGAGSALFSSSNQAVSSTPSINFINNGIKLDTHGNVNANDGTYVAWAWKAGGAPSSSALSLSSGVGAGTIANTGNVTSITQSVNQNSGFSITKYTGGSTGANQTSSFPHNLAGTPELIIVKNISDSAGFSWMVYANGLTANHNLSLDNNASEQVKNRGIVTAPSASLINLNSGTDTSSDYHSQHVNRTGEDYICYAWKAVSGVSAFGTYNGGGSGGSVTGLGFKPRLVIGKRTNSSANWYMFDRFRESGDALELLIESNNSDAEYTYSNLTLTVTNDGFTTGNYGTVGASGGTYIYMAFA